MEARVQVTRILVSAYTVPAESAEADGTYAWDETTMVVVQAEAGGQTGLGYTYGNIATAHLIAKALAPVVLGRDARS